MNHVEPALVPFKRWDLTVVDILKLFVSLLLRPKIKRLKDKRIFYKKNRHLLQSLNDKDINIVQTYKQFLMFIGLKRFLNWKFRCTSTKMVDEISMLKLNEGDA